MSSSGDGDKPAQTGLVDMGDISFYNNPYNPSFNISEIAPYRGSFSELVLNVTWAQLQGTEGGALTTSAIDSAIAQVNAYNAANGTNLGIKLRVWGGYTAPDWAKNIDGPPITVTGEAEVDPAVYTPPDDRSLLDRRLYRRLDEPPTRRFRVRLPPPPTTSSRPPPRTRPSTVAPAPDPVASMATPPGKLRVAASTSCPPADSRLRSAAGRPPCPAPWR
jgi:hypothetical protein